MRPHRGAGFEAILPEQTYPAIVATYSQEDGMGKRSGYRWFVVVVFFLFMFLHQTDRLMIGSMQVPIMGEFKISDCNGA
jgi:hypothetical protein